MSRTTKIIFLDFDGPISNYRTALQTGHHEEFDPVAVEALDNICAVSGAKIVCSSSRTCKESRPSFLENKRLFENAGFDMRNMHEDWSCWDANIGRTKSIERWLKNHPEITHYAIIDDDIVDLPNFIHIDAYDGILLKDFQKVAEYLAVDIGDAFKRAAYKRNDYTQLRLELEEFDRQYNVAVHREHNNKTQKRNIV